MLYFVDIMLNFRTTFINADGLVIEDSRKMASHYLQGWFFIDCLTALPWQIFQIAVAVSGSHLVTYLKPTANYIYIHPSQTKKHMPYSLTSSYLEF